MDGLAKILRWLVGLIQSGLQYFARFLLHRAPVLGGADAELALGGFRKLTNGDAGHAINDSSAIIDGTTIMC